MYVCILLSGQPQGSLAWSLQLASLSFSLLLSCYCFSVIIDSEQDRELD